jgi:hypothetical protein
LSYLEIGMKLNSKNEDFYIVNPDIKKKNIPLKIYGEVHKHDGYSSFNSGAVFPKPNGDNFDINFPPIIIDGDEVTLPILHIKKTIWVGISPFNC